MEVEMNSVDAAAAAAAAATSTASLAAAASSSSSAAVEPLQSFPLLLLPLELISYVSSFSRPSELLCDLLPTSRILREIIESDADLWQQICERKWNLPTSRRGRERSEEEDAMNDSNSAATTVWTDDALDWFIDDESTTAAAAAASSSSSSTPNPFLRTFRSLTLTPARPLALRVLHSDDPGYSKLVFMTPQEQRAIYGVGNILNPAGKAYSTQRNKNVHVILALARSAAEEAAMRRTGTAAAESNTPMLPALPANVAAAAVSSAAASSAPMPLPASFLLSSFKIVSPSSGYTSPLSSGLVFFTDHLPTPAEIAQWDDWSEAQWNRRQVALEGGDIEQRRERLEQERTQGIERGEAEVPPANGEDEEEEVESWYADVPRPPTPAAVSETYPLQFVPSDVESASVSSSSSAPLSPLVAYFRLEANGLIRLENAPALVHVEVETFPGQPAEDVAMIHRAARVIEETIAEGLPPPTPLPPTVATVPTAAAATTATSAASSSSTAAAASASAATPTAPDAWRAHQSPYSYRHQFATPVYGRFITLTFLRATQEQSNIDVAYFGVKGWRRGMTHVAPGAIATKTKEKETQEEKSSAAVAAAAAPGPVAPSAVVDPAYDAFDFDQPLSSHAEVNSRLARYLASLQRMGRGMAEEVQHLDQHLERVQSVLQAQQRAQQQQQTLRLRMLLLQTQQLQLQLANQHLATRVTLQHAQDLNDRAQSFVAQRRNVLDQVEQEREAHRTRLAQLTEEKAREDALLVDLRQRVHEAKEREEDLRNQLRTNQAARDRLDAQRAATPMDQGQQAMWRANAEPLDQPMSMSMSSSAAAATPSAASVSSIPAESRRLMQETMDATRRHDRGLNARLQREMNEDADDEDDDPADEEMTPQPTYSYRPTGTEFSMGHLYRSQYSAPAAAAAATSSSYAAASAARFSMPPPSSPPAAAAAAGAAPTSTLSHAAAVSERTEDLLARLRASRLQREAESQAIHERMQARRQAEANRERENQER